ncbi:MAG: DUF3293 domain-containing protein [Rhodanobacteraceae bacterium]|nr:MAG: DUF3293 domain-containing protein [Rhodanobacteraceae bacterium]
MPLPESIRRAWTETDYRVRLPHGGYVSIWCGRPLPPQLLALLRHADDPWGYITAWNPAGVSLSLASNKIRQRRLRDEIKGDRHRYFGGLGVGASDWREPSLFVPGMTYAQLDAMARRFGQLGVVRGTGAGVAELHELI